MSNSRVSRFVRGVALAVLATCLYPLVASACDAFEQCANGTVIHSWCDNGGCFSGCYCTGGGGCVGYRYTDTCSGMIKSYTLCCDNLIE